MPKQGQTPGKSPKTSSSLPKVTTAKPVAEKKTLATSQDPVKKTFWKLGKVSTETSARQGVLATITSGSSGATTVSSEQDPRDRVCNRKSEVVTMTTNLKHGVSSVSLASTATSSSSGQVSIGTRDRAFSRRLDEVALEMSSRYARTSASKTTTISIGTAAQITATLGSGGSATTAVPSLHHTLKETPLDEVNKTTKASPTRAESSKDDFTKTNKVSTAKAVTSEGDFINTNKSSTMNLVMSEIDFIKTKKSNTLKAESSEGDYTKTTKASIMKVELSAVDFSKTNKVSIVKAETLRGVTTKTNKPITIKATCSRDETTKTMKPSLVKPTSSQGGKTIKGSSIKPKTLHGEATKTTKPIPKKATTSQGDTSKTTKVETTRPGKTNPDAAMLANLESPFTWNLEDFGRKLREPMLDFLRAKMEKKVEYRDERNEGDSTWRILVVNLVLCFESFRLGETTKALVYVEESVAAVALTTDKGYNVTSSSDKECKVTSSHDKECKVTSSADRECKLTSSQDGEELTQAIKEAFRHVLLSCRHHVALTEVGRRGALYLLTCKAGFTQQVKAALLGIRAAVTMEYGPTSTSTALPLLEKAVISDPSGPQWQFLLAKCLGRSRRAERFDAVSDVPYTTEVAALESLVGLSGRPFHVVFLAGVCRGVAATLSGGEGPRLVREAVRLNDRALELYQQAALAAPDCAYTNIRCAEGYMLLPMTSHQNMTRAYELGKTAVTLTPDNAMVNHIWGRINEAMGFEEKALRFLKVAARAGTTPKANLDLLALKMKRDKTYNPIPELEEMLAVFDTSVHRQEICAHICSHCLLVLVDVPRAVKWCDRVLELDPQSDKLTHHRPLRSPSHVNLYRELMTCALQASKEDRAAIFSKIV